MLTKDSWIEFPPAIVKWDRMNLPRVQIKNIQELIDYLKDQELENAY